MKICTRILSKVFMGVLILGTMFLVVGCQKSDTISDSTNIKETVKTETESQQNSTEVETLPEPFVTISILYDQVGNVSQKIIYNKDTQLMYVYDYFWAYDEGTHYILVSTKQTVFNSEGHNVQDVDKIDQEGTKIFYPCY